MRFVANDNPTPPGTPKTLSFSYGTRNRLVDLYMENTKLGLIRNITDEQEQLVRGILDSSLRQGLGPDVTARRIRDVVASRRSRLRQSPTTVGSWRTHPAAPWPAICGTVAMMAQSVPRSTRATRSIPPKSI